MLKITRPGKPEAKSTCTFLFRQQWLSEKWTAFFFPFLPLHRILHHSCHEHWRNSLCLQAQENELYSTQAHSVCFIQDNSWRQIKRGNRRRSRRGEGQKVYFFFLGGGGGSDMQQSGQPHSVRRDPDSSTGYWWKIRCTFTQNSTAFHSVLKPSPISPCLAMSSSPR